MTLATEAPVVLSQTAATGLAKDATRPFDSISTLISTLSQVYGLDEREREIVQLLMIGDDLRSIARRLRLSVRMASWQLQDVFAKTNTDSAEALMRLAQHCVSEREGVDAPVRAMPRWDNVNARPKPKSG